MARFYGRVGFAQDATETESGSGVWVEKIIEQSYYGDVIRDMQNIQSGENTAPNISVSNSISIIADPYANDHFFAIRYVEWAGVLWTVTHVEVISPRLLLTLGDKYNGPIPN